MRKMISRRKLLGSVGAIATSGAVAGCSVLSGDSQTPEVKENTPTQTETDSSTADEQTDIPWSDEYGTVVDLVKQGADPKGNQSMLPLLKEYSSDNTLLYLRPGRYLMDDFWQANSFERLAIYGNDATIVPPDRYSGPPLFIFGNSNSSRDLSVEGLHFDFSGPGTGPSPLFALVDDGLYVKDISVTGSCRSTRFEVMERGGTGYIENVHLPDGGYPPDYPPGCYISEYNRGTLTLKDFHIANFPNNGIYASGSRGKVRVIGGVFENNDISNVRVGDDSVVRDVTIRCDDSGKHVKNMRGIWARGEGVTVENCQVELAEGPISDGAIVLSENATVRDSQIVTDAEDVAAVLGVEPTGNGRGERDNSNTSVREVDISGKASDGAAVTMINRNKCVFTDIVINQSGANRDAFEFFNVSDAVIKNASIDVHNNSTFETLEV
jgi:hypothetical protein